MDAVIEYRDFIVNAEIESGSYKTDINKFTIEMKRLKRELLIYAENVSQMISRLKYDVLYVENMSLMLDFKIMFLLRFSH